MSYYVTLTPDGGIEIGPFDAGDTLGGTLPFLQDQVQGYIEHLDVICKDKNLDLWINEEGLLRGLPYNAVASEIVNKTWTALHYPTDGSFIVGNAVILASDDDGETRGLTLEEVGAVSSIVMGFAEENGIDVTVE
jgi:hypothetical protein